MFDKLRQLALYEITLQGPLYSYRRASRGEGSTLPITFCTAKVAMNIAGQYKQIIVFKIKIHGKRFKGKRTSGDEI